jgi:ATP-dependent helicase/DNAse subunit B
VARTQAQLHLILGTDPRLLLEQAAAEFLVPQHATPDNPFPSPSVVLALRQGGIRDDLYSLAHERGVGGWYDPPLCTFQELPTWLGQTTRRPLTELDRRMLLGRLVRERATGMLGKLKHLERFLSAVDQLIGELVSEGVEAASFANALAAREGRDDFEQVRDAELASIYAGYLEALETANRRDGRDTWADCGRAITASPDTLTAQLGGRRELRLFGLQDLRNGWRPLLRALRSHPALDRIAIYSSEALDLKDDLQPTLTRLEEPDSIARRLFNSSATNRDGTVQVIAAPDVEREMEEVARRIRGLADEGVPLHRMAVVARQARPYTDLAASALERFGVPVTVRRRYALRDVPVVRALDALLKAAADGWSRHGLAELADQPYFDNEIDAGQINDIGYQRRVSGLTDWAAAVRAAGPEARAEAFDRFAERARALDTHRSLKDWLAWLHRFLTDDPWKMKSRIDAVPGDRYDVVRLDLAGWKGLTGLVEQWVEAVEGWGAPGVVLDAEGFHAQLTDLLDHEIALWSSTRRGVPVIEGLAAMYRNVDHLFIVGLESGRFPVRAPGSPLFDDSERASLVDNGIPLELRAEWDRREQELFRILTAAAHTSLTVSYSRLDPAGREVVRSSFVEALGEVATLAEEQVPPSRVLTPGVRICATPAAAEHAGYAARVELDRARATLSPWNGQIVEPALVARLTAQFGDDYLWSPTQLESYAKCPWAYFSSKLLRVEERKDPEDEMDPKTYGSVVHDALRRFYDGEYTRRGGPVLLRAEDEGEAIPRLHAALEEALEATGETAWLGHPSLAPAKRANMIRTLTRYLAFEIEYNEKLFKNNTKNGYILRTGVETHELSFREVVLERGGIQFRFRGTIDRVEVGIDERVESSRYVAAVDYKSSKYAAPGGGNKKAWDEGVVLQVPLYAHALTTLRPGSVVSRVEYRALKQRETLHSLQLVSVNRKTKELRTGGDEQEQMEAALDAVVRHVKQVRGGAFPAEPPPTCGCPSFCHARDICRVAGGPREPVK